MDIIGSNFKIFSLQFSIFTPSLLFDRNKILKKLMEGYSDDFDGETISIPFSDDTPKSIPEIILRSNEGRKKIEVAKSRVNIYLYSKDLTGVDSEIESFLSFCVKIIDTYKDCTNATIGRLAIVMNKILPIDNSSFELAKHFCKPVLVEEEPFNRPEKFEINALKKYDLEEFNNTEVNSWVKCKNETLSLDDKSIEVIYVQQDINTLPEVLESTEYSLDEVQKFVEVVPNQHEVILNKYFPGSNNGN